MNHICFKYLLNLLISPINKLPVSPKLPKLVFLLLILCSFRLSAPTSTLQAATPEFLEDLIDTDTIKTIIEQETNDYLASAQNLHQHFALSNTIVPAIQIEGELQTTDDVDIFRFSVEQGTDLEIKFEALGTQNHTLTALTTGPDGKPCFVADGINLWKDTPTGPLFLASADDFARNLEHSQPGDIAISNIGVTSNGTILVTLAGHADIFSVDLDKNITVVLTCNDVTSQTGEDSAILVALAVDIDDTIYLADQVSGNILSLGADLSDLRISTSFSDLTAALKNDLLIEIENETSDVPATILSQTDLPFAPSSLLWISGHDDYPDGYYVAQLGPALQGDGGITQIIPNQSDPQASIFNPLFVATLRQADLNPTALALASAGNNGFSQKMFLGTSGPDWADQQDGEIFIVEANGTLTNFVTDFVDSKGLPAAFQDQPVSGFFDITDMAFSSGEASSFGNYLYVLSENIDNNGPDTEGGFPSSLWRIDASGVAHLFVPELADAAGALAFDHSEKYGNDLFVAVSHNQSRILRIDPAGRATSFFSFESSSPICDIAFAPDNAVMRGELFITFLADSGMSLVSIDPNGIVTTWATDLPTDDSCSGDIVFNSTGELVLLSTETAGLIRLDYLGLPDYQLIDLQIRPTPDYSDTSAYALLSVLNKPRIVNLAASGLPNTIMTEVGPDILDTNPAPGDGTKNVFFTFDDFGDIYLFVQNSGLLITSTRDEQQGRFLDFTTILTGETIDTAANLTDVRLSHLAWTPYGDLFALADNGVSAESTPGNTLMLLGNTGSQSYQPVPYLEPGQLAQIALTLDIPNGTSPVFSSTPGKINDNRQTLNNLPQGNYTLTVDSANQSTGSYKIIVALDQIEKDFVVNSLNSPLVLKNGHNERIELDYVGPGRALFRVKYRPLDQVILETISLKVMESGSRSALSLFNLDNSHNFQLQNITLGGTMFNLNVMGTVDLITAAEGEKGTIKTLSVGDLLDIRTPDFNFTELSIDNLGSPDTTDHTFQVRSAQYVDIAGNVNNVNFFDTKNRNQYQEINIGGVFRDSIFQGGSIKSMNIYNRDQQEDALADSTIYLTNRLKDFAVDYGDISNCLLYIENKIDSLELSHGNLVDSDVIAAHTKKGQIAQLSVLSSDNFDDASDKGHILNCDIDAGRQIKHIHADGLIDADTQISASNSLSSKINRISSSGNCAAIISSPKINEILVGFDRFGKRIAEDDTFTGSDFTGSVSTIYALKKISATGSIRNANLQSSFKSIENIFAEDGLDAVISARNNKISKIMVGFIDGNPKKIVNPAADIAGSIDAKSIGNLIYTGDLESQSLPSKLGKLKDLIDDF